MSVAIASRARTISPFRNSPPSSEPALRVVYRPGRRIHPRVGACCPETSPARRIRTMQDSAIEAVVFDLDGVIVDSEHVWDAAREALARERGGNWHEGAQGDMMGMSSVEWSRYMHEVIGLRDPPEEISAEVVRRLQATYPEEVPRGKPSPDVYLEAARRLGADPSRSAAVEDSRSGILSASAAGMRVVAVPNRRFPPGEEALAT